MSSELAIALAGLALGVFNVIAWVIERRDRKTEIAEERAVRNRQFELDQQRFDAEMADRESQRRAQITAVQNGFHTEGSNRLYRLTIRNLGPSWAKHVHVWLTDQRECLVSNTARVGPLGVEEERQVTLGVSLDALRSTEVETLVPWFNWYDDTGGPYFEPSNAEIDRS